jgi:hypothetical protein
MTKKQTFITLALVASLILTACLTDSAEPVNDEAQTSTVDSILDDRILNDALESLDLAKCTTIEASATRETCEIAVGSLVLSEKAKATMDANICKEIENERYRDDCLSTVEEAAKALTAEADRLDIGDRASAESDPDICNEIEDEGQSIACRFNVIIDLAKANNDPGLCDEIGEEGATSECKSVIENAQEV